ncbi:hypothetical protein Nepgr_027527 [Nepenthes gracilis]|uniref:Histone chaperone domain-containing protein n=1 Tax=Nepenthes gracilis TaxID=150966 RepID=A0AAD3TAY7_NEPGR|nr:hypothetical protein Nepgr_027527 [Nepenthes gracilis]
MEEDNNWEDSALPTARNLDLSFPEATNHPKKQKLEVPESTSAVPEPDEKIENNGAEDPGNLEENAEDCVVQKGKAVKEEVGDGENEDSEHFNGKAVVDRKGKGILIEGSEEEEEEDDDDDDSSDDGDNLSDGDSDLSDDPLAEVDLDNILPSRTRRRVVHPGAYIATNLSQNDDDDDESDDPDA